MTEPENYPREKATDTEATKCSVCGEQLTAGETRDDGSVVLSGHDHDAMEVGRLGDGIHDEAGNNAAAAANAELLQQEQADLMPPREQGTVVQDTNVGEDA